VRLERAFDALIGAVEARKAKRAARDEREEREKECRREKEGEMEGFQLTPSRKTGGEGGVSRSLGGGRGGGFKLTPSWKTAEEEEEEEEAAETPREFFAASAELWRRIERPSLSGVCVCV
jgi:hypothetical protein